MSYIIMMIIKCDRIMVTVNKQDMIYSSVPRILQLSVSKIRLHSCKNLF